MPGIRAYSGEKRCGKLKQQIQQPHKGFTVPIDYKTFRRFEDELARREGPLDHGQALTIFKHLWEEGQHLGVLPLSAVSAEDAC